MPDYTREPDQPLDQAPADVASSHPNKCKPGRNDVVVSTMHYGLNRMIFEKDVAALTRDGTVVYVNVSRPPAGGRFPVVVSFDIYRKGSVHMASGMPAGGPYTLGQYNASLFAPWEAPDPGFWVPNGYVVVKVAARGWLRVSHRELDLARAIPYQPWLEHERALKLAPSEFVPVDIEIWPSSILFRADESLQVTVQGGSFAYTRSNPLPLKHGRICTEHDETINAGRHILHGGGDYDSHLLVPVVPLST